MESEDEETLPPDSDPLETRGGGSNDSEHSTIPPRGRANDNDDSELSTIPPTKAFGSPEETLSLPNEAETDDSSDSTPRWIGRYRLLQQIGEGGMGTVWMAEQREPVQRRVALKLIKGARADKQILARFEAERQAVAMMNHENIAKILDAGTTDDGSPFFAMELVQGIPLTEYCNQNRLTPKQRLELFVPVCQAVQHAHQKGIIHRDLKPSNILVGTYDGKPVAKVIDFGLAKALERQTKLTDKTMFTEFGQVLGTIQYMSPEQAQLDALDVDTRTDIYSLGVILYELLTGGTPINRETLKQNALLKVLEIIREKEPPLPSQRLSSSHDLLSVAAERQQIEPKSLQSMLRGELDWIVMKTLDKDRTRRYEAAASLADDIQRFLDNEPIEARPPSLTYRLGKFARKHRLAFATITAATFLTLGGLITTSVLYQRASAAESVSSQVNELLTQILESADPSRSLGESLTVIEFLDAAATQLDAKENLAPEVEAPLRVTVGNAYQHLFRLDKAITHLSRAVDLWSQADDSSQLAHALTQLSGCEFEMRDYESAGASSRRAFEIQKKLGRQDEDTILALRTLADCQLQSGQNTESRRNLGMALRLAEQLPEGQRWYSTSTVLHSVGALEYAERDVEKAGDFFSKCLSLRKEHLTDIDPKIAQCQTDLAAVHLLRGENDTAEELLRHSESSQRKVLPANDLRLALTLQHWATIPFQNEDFATAASRLKEAKDIWEANRANGENYVIVLKYYALCQLKLGEFQESQKSLETALHALESLRDEEKERHRIEIEPLLRAVSARAAGE